MNTKSASPRPRLKIDPATLELTFAGPDLAAGFALSAGSLLGGRAVLSTAGAVVKFLPTSEGERASEAADEAFTDVVCEVLGADAVHEAIDAEDGQ